MAMHQRQHATSGYSVYQREMLCALQADTFMRSYNI